MEDCSKPVTVTCPNHHDQLVKGLWNFVQTSNFVDYDFQWGGESRRAHQVIVEVFLSPEKASNVSPSAFEHDQTRAAQARDRRSNNDRANSDRRINLDSVLEFLYNGSVTVDDDQLDDLVAVAEELNFQLLVDAARTAKRCESLLSCNDDVSEGKIGTGVRACRRQKTGLTSLVTTTKREPRRRKQDVSKSSAATMQTESKSSRKSGSAAAGSTKKQQSRKSTTRPPPPTIVHADSAEEEKCHLVNKEDNMCVESQLTAVEYPVSVDGSCQSDSSVGWQRKSKKANVVTTKKIRSVAKRRTAAATVKPRKTGASRTKKPKSTALKDLPIFECGHCDYKTRNKAWLPIHMSKHDKSIAVFRCGSCYRQYLTEEALQHHKEVAHAGDPEVFQCPHCEYKARNKNWYNVHLAKHDPSVEIFRCDLCDKPFFTQESVVRHKDRHKQYKCPQCPFETPKALSYYQHRFTVHEVDGKGRPLVKLNCSECKFTCKKRSELKYHVLAMHSGTKPFQCPQCPYVTGRKSEVNRHIKVAHLDLKPHLCDTCGFRTVSQSALDLHKRSHTGEKPYKCDTCGQLFGQASKLSKHVRRHISDERPYICHVCGSAFNRRYHLKIHLKNVHKLVPDLI